MAESDRELRAELEGLQHEVRGLQHELTVEESPAFVEKRAALQAEIPPLKARVDVLEADVKESAKTLAAAKTGLATLEQNLREVEQRSLSFVVALIAVGVLSVVGPWVGSLSMELLAAISGLGLGWLLSGHKAVPPVQVQEEEEAAPSAPRAVLSAGLPIAMLLLSPLLFVMSRDVRHLSHFTELLRFVGPSLFVVLGGLATRLSKRAGLLASAMIVVSLIAGLVGRLAFKSPVEDRVVNEWAAMLASCFSLPVILAGQWAASVSRRNRAWRVVSTLLLMGASWSTWWLMATFLHEEPVPFSSFAGFAMELSIAAWFFMLDVPRGRTRSVLLAVSSLLFAWIVLVYSMLDTVRFG